MTVDVRFPLIFPKTDPPIFSLCSILHTHHIIIIICILLLVFFIFILLFIYCFKYPWHYRPWGIISIILCAFLWQFMVVFVKIILK